jgi:hypothetical protein
LVAEYPCLESNEPALGEGGLDKVRAQSPEHPHDSPFHAIEVGLAALDETTRVRYLWLAVVPDDMPIASAVQRTLWGTSDAETLDTAERLIGLSLAERVGDGAIRFHDSQLDYTCARAGRTRKRCG